MIIVSINGGLGNQLFQYALGRHLALINNTELKLDLSVFKNPNHRKLGLTNFNIDINIATEKDLPFTKRQLFKNKRRIASLLDRFFPPINIKYENHFHFDDDVLKYTNNTYLWGYWQSEKYFKSIESIIRTDLTFKQPITVNEKEIITLMSSVDSVCLHVRRGDYINNVHHPVCSISYYNEAIAFILKKLTYPHIFIFSDEINWAKSNLKIPCKHTYITGFEDWIDLRLMTYCKHNIIANSSFSWWGAYLGQYEHKIVISPKNWFFDMKKYDIKDLKPKNWLSL